MLSGEKSSSQQFSSFFLHFVNAPVPAQCPLESIYGGMGTGYGDMRSKRRGTVKRTRSISPGNYCNSQSINGMWGFFCWSVFSLLYVCPFLSLSLSFPPSLPPSFPPSLPPSFLPDSVTLDNYTTLMQCFPPTPYQMLPADKQADLVELELWHESNFLEFKKAQEEETKCRLAQNNKYKMYRSGGVLFHSVKFGELY